MSITYTIPDDLRSAMLAHGLGALPKEIRSEIENETIEAAAEVMALATGVIEDWLRQTYILKAEGKWLDEHARDRGQRRTTGETDDALRQRLRTFPDAVTPPTILAAAQAILDALEGSGFGTVYMLELPRDAAYCLSTQVTPADADGFGFFQSPVAGSTGFGFHCANTTPTFILILPLGTGSATEAAIIEMAAQLKAAGVEALIEVRLP